MSVRATFVKTLLWGAVRIGVKAYNVHREYEPPLRTIHVPCAAPVKEQLVCSACGASGETGKAAERNGILIPLPPDALAALTPEDTDLAVLCHTEALSLDPLWFRDRFYLAPDGPQSLRSYALLTTVMREGEWGALITGVIRKKHRIGAIMPLPDRGLLLSWLVIPEDRTALDPLLPPRGVALRPEELEMGMQLARKLLAPVKFHEFKDPYRTALADLIDQQPAPSLPVSGGDLSGQLTQSLRRSRRKT